MSDTAHSSESGTPDVPIPQDNGGPASEKELGDLAAHWNGSNATSPTGSQSESHLDTPPKTGNPGSSGNPQETGGPEELGGPDDESAVTFERTTRPSRGREEVPLPLPGTEQPKPRAARGSRRVTPPAEAVRETSGTGEPPPTEKTQPATEPPPGETPEDQNISTDEVATAGPPPSAEEAVPETSGTGEPPAEPHRWTQEAALRDIEAARQMVREEAANDIARIDQEAQAHKPPPAETAGPRPAPEPEPAPEPAPEVVETPKPVSELEEQVEERFSRVKTGTVLSAGDKSWRIGKIEEKEIGGHPVTLYWTKRADGTLFYFAEGDVKEIIRDNLSEKHQIAEEKAAARIKQEKVDQQAAEKAERETVRADREKQLAAERDAKEAAKAARTQEESAQRETYKKLKAETNKTFNDRVERQLKSFREAEVGAKLQRGKQTLTFEKYDSSISNPYKFEDKTGQNIFLSEAEVKKLLAERLRAEDKTALEQLKQTHGKEKPAAAAKEEAKKPEKPTPKWKERLAAAGALAEKAGGAVKKGAEVTPVTRILYNITNGFLNKFDLRDKDIKAWLAGAATGTLLTIGLDNFLGFLGVGPSRIIRSALSSGVIIGGSAGVNIRRNGAVGRILENYGVKDAVERKSYIQKFDTAFRLLRTGDEGKYHEAMRALSNAIFSKHGTAAHRGNVEYELPEAAVAELQKTIESLNTKYQKLNNTIRSFSAGLVAGTVGTGLARCFLLPKLESLLDRIHGGGHITPVPGIEHGTPTHAPPVEGHTATPTPTPGLEHTPTPIPGQVPPGTSPEALHVFQSLPPDQQARLTDIASDPAKLDAFNHWIAAHEAILPGAQPISEILANPDLAHSVVIHSGNTVGQIFVNNGQPLTWGPGNADLFGTHILANYDMLHTMHDNVVAAGLATSNFPTQEAVVNLIKAADAGDAAAFQDLVNAAHWIPVGDNWNELTDFGQEAVKKSFGIP